MYTTPEDWFSRLKAAGGNVRIDALTLTPGEKPIGPEVLAIWNEILAGTEERWNEVEAYLRQRFGPVSTWVDV